MAEPDRAHFLGDLLHRVLLGLGLGLELLGGLVALSSTLSVPARPTGHRPGRRCTAPPRRRSRSASRRSWPSPRGRRRPAASSPRPFRATLRPASRALSCWAKVVELPEILGDQLGLLQDRGAGGSGAGGPGASPGSRRRGQGRSTRPARRARGRGRRNGATVELVQMARGVVDRQLVLIEEFGLALPRRSLSPAAASAYQNLAAQRDPGRRAGRPAGSPMPPPACRYQQAFFCPAASALLASASPADLARSALMAPAMPTWLLLDDGIGRAALHRGTVGRNRRRRRRNRSCQPVRQRLAVDPAERDVGGEPDRWRRRGRGGGRRRPAPDPPPARWSG